MKQLLKSLFVCSCGALDALCVAAVLAGPHGRARVAGLVALHAACVLAAAVGLYGVAPIHIRRGGVRFIAFASLVGFFLPVASSVGLLAALLLGAGGARVVREDPWLTLVLDEQLVRDTTTRRRVVSATKLRNILTNRAPAAADRRFQAILQVRYLPPATSVALLKLALKDASDEVRLFAFSRIELMRNEIDTKVKELTASLAAAENDERPLYHLRLGETYFSIAHLRLAEGAVLEFALDNARKHTWAACELRPGNAPAEYLLGRILARQADHAAALAAFDRARMAGYASAKALPHMAASAFYLRDFERVRAFLAQLPPRAPETATLAPVVDFWR